MTILAGSTEEASVTSLRQKYVGTYQGHALLKEPLIKSGLGDLLGEQYPHFLRNLEVNGPVDLISESLSLSGNAVHMGGEEEAVLCVGTPQVQVTAAIFSHGLITIYSFEQEYQFQSRCMKDWITQVNSGHRDRLIKPENVRIRYALGSGDPLKPKPPQ